MRGPEVGFTLVKGVADFIVDNMPRRELSHALVDQGVFAMLGARTPNKVRKRLTALLEVPRGDVSNQEEDEKVDNDKGSLGKNVRIEETLSGLASHACEALAGKMDFEKSDGVAASLSARVFDITHLNEVASIFFKKFLENPEDTDAAIERIAYISRNMPSLCKEEKLYDLANAFQAQLDVQRLWVYFFLNEGHDTLVYKWYSDIFHQGSWNGTPSKQTTQHKHSFFVFSRFRHLALLTALARR